MEVTSFVLGMLTIGVVLLLTAIVVGLLKITKLTNQLANLRLEFERTIESTHRQVDERFSEVWRQFDIEGKDITMVERTIMQRIDQELQEAHRRIDKVVDVELSHVDELNRNLGHEVENLHRDIDEALRNAQSYTDSRIDKTIVTGTLKSSKEVLKG